ncbi:LysR family transcriptional regulator [Vibrio astriarenae]
MAKDLFSKLDLNLLRTFLVINQELNMRKAAERLFISQPAVSKALQRLRDSFEDELFVKTYHGLRATERAEQLAVALEPLMGDLTQVVNYSGGFDPNDIDRTLKVAVSPFLLSGIALRLFEKVREEAPHAQLQLLNWNKLTIKDIINDKIHIGLNYPLEHVSKELLQKNVTKDNFKAYVRNQHPYTQPSMDMDQAVDFEFATLIAADWNSRQSLVEKYIEARGLATKVGFRSELPSAVLDVIRSTDMMFLGSSFMNLNSSTDLRPIEIFMANEQLNTDINLYFHDKHQNSQTMLWLKSKIAEVLLEVEQQN